MSEITMSEFDELCRKSFEKKKVIDEINESLKLHTKQLEEMKAQVLACFDNLMLEKYSIKDLGTLYKNTRFTVRVPTGDERKKFFEYLKDKGVFDEMITVNSQTLNAWFQQETENEAAKGNFEFNPPGISEAKSVVTLNFRKA